MHLQLDKEAILLGSLKLGTILSDPSRASTGVGLRCWHGDNLTDIAFTGEGAVDGSGKPWWEIAEASRLHLGMHRVEVRHRLLLRGIAEREQRCCRYPRPEPQDSPAPRC